MSKEQKIITPSYRGLKWSEIVSYRELIYAFISRDLRVRYAQSILGISWAIINPLVAILLMTIVFGYILKVDTRGIPFVLITTVGVVVWNFFSSTITEASNVFIKNQSLITKIYFPRIILPIASMGVGMIDLLVALIIMYALVIYYGYFHISSIPYILLLIAYLMYCVLSFSILLSALCVRYRDFVHIIPLLLRIGIYASPVAYLSSAIPQKYELIFFLNPLVGIIDCMRFILLGLPFNPISIYVSVIISTIILSVGIVYFRRIEIIMSDII